MAGKFSCPGLYANLSIKRIRKVPNDNPSSRDTFLTSRPTCKNAVMVGVAGLICWVALPSTGKPSTALEDSAVALEESIVGTGGTGGSVSTVIGEGPRARLSELFPRLTLRGSFTAGSSVSSVRVAKSPGVSGVDPAMIERRAWPGLGTGETLEPVIFWKL